MPCFIFDHRINDTNTIIQMNQVHRCLWVFDDFIAAAEYLTDNNYTSKSKLALSGSSNGGLLVGAVMLQRPDLMKVAIPGVGVLDMLRYHKFTIGWAWAGEYGDSEESEEKQPKQTNFETFYLILRYNFWNKCGRFGINMCLKLYPPPFCWWHL